MLPLGNCPWGSIAGRRGHVTARLALTLALIYPARVRTQSELPIYLGFNFQCHVSSVKTPKGGAFFLKTTGGEQVSLEPWIRTILLSLLAYPHKSEVALSLHCTGMKLRSQRPSSHWGCKAVPQGSGLWSLDPETASDWNSLMQIMSVKHFHQSPHYYYWETTEMT